MAWTTTARIIKSSTCFLAGLLVLARPLYLFTAIQITVHSILHRTNKCNVVQTSMSDSPKRPSSTLLEPPQKGPEFEDAGAQDSGTLILHSQCSSTER